MSSGKLGLYSKTISLAIMHNMKTQPHKNKIKIQDGEEILCTSLKHCCNLSIWKVEDRGTATSLGPGWAPACVKPSLEING